MLRLNRKFSDVYQKCVVLLSSLELLRNWYENNSLSLLGTIFFNVIAFYFSKVGNSCADVIFWFCYSRQYFAWFMWEFYLALNFVVKGNFFTSVVDHHGGRVMYQNKGVIDLYCRLILFTQYRSHDDTPESDFFESRTFSCLHTWTWQRFDLLWYCHMICIGKKNSWSKKRLLEAHRFSPQFNPI